MQDRQLALVASSDPRAATNAAAAGTAPSAAELPRDSGGTLGQIFNTKKPGHIGKGLVSGAGNVFKGVALGLTSLVAAPVVGGMTDGAKGAVKGLGVGVIAAVTLPIAGVVTGFGQVGGGAMNTVQAVQEIGKGTVYNDKTEKWEPKYRRLSEQYRLAEARFAEFQAERQRTPPPAAAGERRAASAPVADREYYDVLQVAPDASRAEIRKAYHRLARENHPDKCGAGGDGEAAKLAFQRIGEAYQVLGNDATRAQYDRLGKEATEHVEFVDHNLFFAILFGSEAMTPFVGNLVLGSLMAAGEDSSSSAETLDLSRSLDPREQEWRVAQLAVNLRELCEPAVAAHRCKDDRSVKAWQTQQRQTAAALCAQSFGWQMVDAIGFTYENYAAHFLAKDSFMQFATAKTNFKKTSRQVGTLYSALRAVKSANDVRKKADKIKHVAGGAGGAAAATTPSASSTDAEPAESARLMEEGMQHVMKLMLQLCLHDVLTTVRTAAQRYLNDRAVPAPEQKLRAHVLRDLGAIFLAAARARQADDADVDLCEYMHEAYVKMAQKMDERGAPNAE